MFPTEILICTTCRPATESRDVPAAGHLLLEAVADAIRSAVQAGTASAPRLRGIECLNGCSRACTVAFQARGKHTYVFGDLQADTATAVQVLACAVLHQQSTDGLLLRTARPERLRKGILVKLPPLEPIEQDRPDRMLQP